MDKAAFDTAIAVAARDMFGDRQTAIDYGANLEDSGLDSLQMGNFLLAFEEASGVQIPEETIDRMWEATTFGEVVRILQSVAVGDPAQG